MAQIDLRVLICGKPAGTLAQDERGLMSFCYDASYQGIPLSLTMPLSNRVYSQNAVRPYLFGLLPDSEAQRRAIAREHDARPNNPVALLAHIGLDCPGGVQFCRPEDEEKVLAREGGYRPLSDHEIASKLAELRENRTATWMGSDESWSLGGNQGKFALAWHDGSWCECLGSAPTTHIFKNGVQGLMLEALNEFVCMRCAERSGINASHVDYLMFENEPALVVERYDRAADADGCVQRLHQEDLCQALGVMPQQKYTSDGGPSATDVVALLGKTNHAGYNVASFTQMLFYNCLIGAPDAHAKNYSLLLGAGMNAVLAPLYDVASGLAYESLRERGRLAMAIGGENRFGRVGSGAVERYEKAVDFAACGLQRNTPLTIMTDLVRKIPGSLAEVFDEAERDGVPGASELRSHLERAVAANCEATLRLL